MKSLWIKSIFILTALFITSCSEINKNFQYDFSSANDYLKKYKEFLIKSDSIFNDYDTYTKSVLNLNYN